MNILSPKIEDLYYKVERIFNDRLDWCEKNGTIEDMVNLMNLEIEILDQIINFGKEKE